MKNRNSGKNWILPDYSYSIWVLIRRRSFVGRIESITADALIVHGDKDRLVDVASARWLAKLRPDWQLEIFENVGHVPQLEAPDRLLDVVERWLATRSEHVSSGEVGAS